MTLNQLEERIKKIDTKYPWIINRNTVPFHSNSLHCDMGHYYCSLHMLYIVAKITCPWLYNKSQGTLRS